MRYEDDLNQTLSDRIAAGLAKRIVEGEFLPGERLVEATIAGAIGVSHGPIRDALRLLQTMGLVTLSPFKGAQVTVLTQSELLEIYEVRALLAGLRARWMAEDPLRLERIAALELPIRRLGELCESLDQADEYVTVALEVSRVLTDQLRSRWLRDMMQSLSLQTSRYTRLALAAVERRRHSSRQWAEILDAIKSGAGDRAQSLATALSLSTRDAALNALSEIATEQNAKSMHPERTNNRHTRQLTGGANTNLAA